MRKQVTFAEDPSVYRRQQDEGLQRSSEADRTTTDAHGNTTLPQRPGAPIKIPRAMSAAPYLRHAALTPAQRQFLCTIAASHSPAHVRSLMAQHYMNVMHRCVCTENRPERDQPVDAASPERERPPDAPPAFKPSGRLNVSSRRAGKSFLSNRSARSFNSSSSNQRKTKKPTSPSARRKRSARDRMNLEEEEEEEEFTLDDSLSESLTSLSMAEWDDDTFSDL